MQKVTRDTHIPQPRQKACNACARTKVRCDMQLERCTRCRIRDTKCVYPSSEPSAPYEVITTQVYTPDSSEDHHGNSIQAIPPTPEHLPPGIRLDVPAASAEESRYFSLTEEFGDGVLVCNIDAPAIETRWLKSFVPSGNQQPKALPPGTTNYIHRVLSSYTSMVARSARIPPFIHHTQIERTLPPSPLMHCLTLLRTLASPKSHSPTVSTSLIAHEISHNLTSHPTSPPSTLLSALQASLLYTLTLTFHPPSPVPTSTLLHAIHSLQTLAHASALHGTSTTSELSPLAPPSSFSPASSPSDWRAWIHVESKRRTLYTLYLLDNLLCTRDSLPIFRATELTGLWAPAGKVAWEARTGEEWRRAEVGRIAGDGGEGLRIEELWSDPEGFGEEDKRRRGERVQGWLERVDGFGMMLFGVTTGING